MGNGSGDTRFKVLAKVTELDERLTKLNAAVDEMVPMVNKILATQNLLIEGFQFFGDHERRIQVLERIAQVRQ